MNTQENSEQRYRLLIYNYLSHKTTAEEKEVLLDWLKQSEENRKLFSDYKKIFDLTVSSDQKSRFSYRKPEALKRLKSKIDPSVSDARRLKIKRLKYYLQTAAAAILIFLIGALTSFWISRNQSVQNLSITKYEVIAPRGGKSEVVLPDGSKVWLNAGSNFRYGADYGINNRDVYLEGEGYFSVMKNPANPFVVNTSGLEIKAFGTSFNVKAYPEEKFVITTLVEGTVKIEGKGLNLSLKPKEVVVLSKESYEIKPDVDKVTTTSQLSERTGRDRSEKKEDISFSKSVQVKSNVNTNIYTSWKDNYWIIESESLRNIASILERKFDVTIRILSPELNQYTFTGTFYKETLEQILDILKLTAPLGYEIKEGIVVIKGEQKRKSIYDNFKTN
ncbi:MAG: FecR family protein [Bacteroidales bacterium]|nr:FecR family protein [Bacteroidales bacterium]